MKILFFKFIIPIYNQTFVYKLAIKIWYKKYIIINIKKAIIKKKMSAQQKAADKQFKKAKQAITTSIFNWSKDYASGASMFDQALKMYKQIPNYDKCLLTLEKLIQCNSQVNKGGDTWAVARNYEEILDIKLKHYPHTKSQELIKIANQAFVSFRMSQSTDKGIAVVAKLAKYLIQRGQKKQGIQYLQQAYQIILSQQKVFKKQQIFNQLVDIYMQNKAYEGVQKLYLQQIKRLEGKDCEQKGLIVLIIIMIQRQFKRAEKKMYQLADIIPSFLTSNECQAADELIKAYNKGQEEKFRKYTTKAIITTIYPVSIVRKLRQINVPKAEIKQKMGNQNQQGESGNNNQLGNILF